jgi:cyclase
LVKTVGFQTPKYVGDPVNAVKIFNEKEADELVVLDIDATTNGTGPNLRLITQFAAECRMPLCYGGGVRTVESARAIVGLGVEKVAISSGAIENPGLIGEVAKEVGSQSVVVVLDVRKDSRSGSYDVWTHNGTRNSGQSAQRIAERVESLGAGELVVNSIDNDGRMQGYDLDLARAMRKAVKLPMTVLGGAGSLKHIGDLIGACGVVGAAAGGLCVF